MLGNAQQLPTPLDQESEVITVLGELDRAALDRLRVLCLGVPATPARTLTIDFRGMTGCPSALFPLLADANATLRAADVRLDLIGLTEALVRIMGPPRPSPG